MTFTDHHSGKDELMDPCIQQNKPKSPIAPLPAQGVSKQAILYMYI